MATKFRAPIAARPTNLRQVRALRADRDDESQERMQQYLYIGGSTVAVLAVLVAGLYWFNSARAISQSKASGPEIQLIRTGVAESTDYMMKALPPSVNAKQRAAILERLKKDPRLAGHEDRS